MGINVSSFRIAIILFLREKPSARNLIQGQAHPPEIARATLIVSNDSASPESLWEEHSLVLKHAEGIRLLLPFLVSTVLV